MPVGALLVVAGVLATLAVLAVGAPDVPAALPFSVHAFCLLALAIVGALYLLDRRNQSVLYVGGTSLLVAAAFAARPLARLASTEAPGQVVAAVLTGVPLEAFVPLLVWLLVRERRAEHGSSPLVVPGLLVAFVTACALLALNLGGAIARLVDAQPSGWVEPWLRDVPGSLFYPTLLAVGAPALLAAPRLRRRRHRMLLAVLLPALALPASVELIEVLEVRSSLSLGLDRAGWLPLLYLPLVLLPFLLLVGIAPPPSKRSVQRWFEVLLTPAALLPFFVIPAGALVARLLTRRDQTVGELLGDPIAVCLALLSVLAAALMSARQEARRAVEHLFHPRLARMRRRLHRLPRRLHGERSGPEIASVLADEIHRGLGVERSSLLLATRSGRELVDVEHVLPPLSISGPLARKLATAEGAIVVDLGEPSFSNLPANERIWLADHDIALLAPLTGADHTLVAALAVGPRERAGEWLREERRLLSALLDIASLVIDVASGDLHDVETVTEGGGHASECVDCGRLHAASAPVCPRCEGLLTPAPVPHTIPGRIRFESRLDPRGEYEMYRARDLSLARVVAVKTPRRGTPQLALALRREARALAKVAHPHLETVFGIETWGGRSYVVLELLREETLETRLGVEGRLPLREMLEIGVAIAAGLTALHGAGVAHRTIQPRAVSWARDGTVKLIDLHAARPTDDPRPESSTRGDSAPSSSASQIQRWMRETAYRPPESAERRPADAAADLWALHATLFHALTGRPPHVAGSLGGLVDRMRHEPVPRVSSLLAGTPIEVDEYFERALHRDPERRFHEAAAVASELASLQETLFRRSDATM